jgi:hypothetical protein
MKALAGRAFWHSGLAIAIQFTVGLRLSLVEHYPRREGSAFIPAYAPKEVSPAASSASGKFCSMRESSNDRDFPESEYSFPGS